MAAAVFSASAANTVSTLSCGGWPHESAVVALALAIQQQIYINTCTEEDETTPCLVLVVVAAFGRRRALPQQQRTLLLLEQQQQQTSSTATLVHAKCHLVAPRNEL